MQVHFDCFEERVPVLGNEAAIRSLILALLDNAVKYSHQGADIRVVLNNKKPEVSLEVIDRGPGISQRELPRIFERFYRGSYAQNQMNDGTGLGLFLAAGLAEKNHARIEVSSQPGKGSTFRVVFRRAV